MWAREHAAAGVAVAPLHDAFLALNPGFKALVTDWQVRGGQPNDHADAAYDATVLSRLPAILDALAPVLAALAAAVPRTARYAPAFAAAAVRVSAGEHRWLASPAVESVHTLWFELHEELIRLTGRTRAAEAAAGRAA